MVEQRLISFLKWETPRRIKWTLPWSILILFLQHDAATCHLTFKQNCFLNEKKKKVDSSIDIKIIVKVTFFLKLYWTIKLRYSKFQEGTIVKFHNLLKHQFTVSISSQIEEFQYSI